MVSAEEHKERSRCGWHEYKAVLGERVWVEQTAPGGAVAHRILLVLVRAVEDGQVEVGRGVVLGHVARVGTEQLVRHERCERERQRRVAVRVRLPLCSKTCQ